MDDKLKEIVRNIKTPGLSNPETYVLKNASFITYVVFIFAD